MDRDKVSAGQSDLLLHIILLLAPMLCEDHKTEPRESKKVSGVLILIALRYETTSLFCLNNFHQFTDDQMIST